MNIVVGYVPSPEGTAAIDYAVTLAGRDGDRVVVVNSGVRGNDAHPAFASAADWDALEERLSSLGIDHELRQSLQAQSPAEEILTVADAVDAGLIVIGLRRRSPVGKLFLGSSSQQVLLDAKCPVVAVKRAE
ncbi:universal stress protein [Nocardioides sp. CER19]|uniref:universal stress protein n=1 Tax=Nocardioides sp. CER19 TaxID=3038538 RepID=UPI002446C692|nr:universal stress protein [Nocardioides sp. CER19]MDH2414599.1 universal stress protein [Nocardioides sp. CER19]